eukprot:6174122-Pleurochrysis_carterae.AAC.1
MAARVEREDALGAGTVKQHAPRVCAGAARKVQDAQRPEPMLHKLRVAWMRRNRRRYHRSGGLGAITANTLTLQGPCWAKPCCVCAVSRVRPTHSATAIASDKCERRLDRSMRHAFSLAIALLPSACLSPVLSWPHLRLLFQGSSTESHPAGPSKSTD